MKRKSNHKKNKKEEIKIIEKEIFNDFLVLEKEIKNDKKEDKKGDKKGDKKEDKKGDKKGDKKEDKKEDNLENKNQGLKKVVSSKKGNESKEDLNDFLKDWILVENPYKKKPEKSRFTDLFNELKEENKKVKNIKTKLEDEDLTKRDSISKTNSSINLSSKITNYDSKILEPLSINDSLIDSNNLNIIIDNKNDDEKKGKIEELDLNLDINKVISLEDKRTTVMIKNLPNKFNKDLLLSIINQNFKGTYDLFILPTDINKYKNFGYSFINFTSSYYIPYFYFLFNGKMWSGTNSKKVCELTYSKVQGKENLLHHYPSKIVYGNEEAFNVTPEQEYIIPNVYKLVFNKFFPKEKIKEFNFYFITKMPSQ